MRVENMIYIYGAVCVSMIVFNVIYALLLRRSEPRMEKRTRRLQRIITVQLDCLRRCRYSGGVEPRHLRYLQKKLRRVKNLTAFDRALQALRQDAAQADAIDAYLTAIQPALLYLSLIYVKRENTQAAYFSYFLSRHMVQRHMAIQTLQDVLLSYMEKENLYCRVNALQSLCTFGDIDHILAALQLQDDGSMPLHEKILTESLLAFTGSHEQLYALLWSHLDGFSPHTQLAVMNYIRFRTGSYTAQVLPLMTDPRRDKEVRLSAIRYFGRYPYEPALEPLLTFAKNNDPLQWEYTTVSVSSLARYHDPRVVDALKGALHSSNWYVRYAAASSLAVLHIPYEDLLDIVNGNDRYAREMMTYQLKEHNMQKAGG